MPTPLATGQFVNSDNELGGTRERLLDAAEDLFAHNGFHGVSLRTITAQAGVNLAAANYHFGSKKGLMREVFKRRLAAIHEESSDLIEKCLQDENPRPDLGQVIAAFLGPSLRAGGGEKAATFRRLAGLAAADPSPEVREIFLELTDDSAQRFVDAVKLACPELAADDLMWRLACVFGTLFYVRANTGRLQRLRGFDADFTDTAEALRHLVPVLVAGFAAAPVPSNAG